jgi:hypothetical protein
MYAIPFVIRRSIALIALVALVALVVELVASNTRSSKKIPKYRARVPLDQRPAS